MNDSSHLAGAVAEKSKRTPGPWQWYWRVEDGEASCGVFWAEREGTAYSVCRAPRYTQKAEWTANARLIAAAPELLEALRTLVSRDFAYYGGFVMDCNITMEEVQRARAAIAKAEGE